MPVPPLSRYGNRSYPSAYEATHEGRAPAQPVARLATPFTNLDERAARLLVASRGGA